jgi:hypothetical protein
LKGDVKLAADTQDEPIYENKSEQSAMMEPEQQTFKQRPAAHSI